MSPHADARPDQPSLMSALGAYARPDVRTSVVQLAGAIVLFVACWAAAYLALRVSLVLGLALTVPTAGLMIRIFVIQHDCGHGALFRSARANAIAGTLCSLFTFTPFAHWRRQHANHHGNWNNLDRRGSGLDIYSDCRTVQEYRQYTPAKRLGYRLMRHPIVAHLIVPPLIFLLLYRTPFDTPAGWRHERRSVHATTLAIVAQAAVLGCVLGFGAVALVELTTLLLAAQVRGCGVDPSARLGPHHGVARRDVVPAPARRAAVVHGKHRLSSRPPSESARSELSPAGGLRGAAGARRRHHADPSGWPARAPLRAVGRGRGEAGALPRRRDRVRRLARPADPAPSSPSIPRRTVLTSALAGATLSCVPEAVFPAHAAVVPSDAANRRFSILRGSDRIGTHTVAHSARAWLFVAWPSFHARTPHTPHCRRCFHTTSHWCRKRRFSTEERPVQTQVSIGHAVDCEPRRHRCAASGSIDFSDTADRLYGCTDAIDQETCHSIVYQLRH